MKDKSPLNIYVGTEIKRWFTEHGISPSQFFESAWNQYIDSDVDTKTKILVSRMAILDGEMRRLDDELEKTSGKRFKQLSLTEVSPLDLRTKEEVGLESLYNALSDDQKRILDGRPTFSGMTPTHLENWIDARKEDFGLLLPSSLILRRLMENGHAHTLCAEGRKAKA